MTRRLDSRSLTQFLAVAETLSFRQAAEMLHISQPPLSRAIGQLEARLGARLFERDTQRVELTAAGRKLLPLARRILVLLDEAEAAMVSLDVPAQLSVGLTTAVEPQWFQHLTETIAKTTPDVSLRVITDSSPRLVRMLARKRLDAAFIALPTQAPGLDVAVLHQQPLMAVLPSGHRLARRRKVSLAELRDDPLFWFQRARQPAFFDHCKKVFNRHGFAPLVLEEPQDHHVLLAQVASGRGIALLPESFATLRRPGVRYKALAEGDELHVGIGLATAPERSAVRDFLLRSAG
jgi:DNA-binding transcriptional LysR family regulator